MHTELTMSPVYNSSIAFNLLRLKFNPFCEEFWLISLNCGLEPTHVTLIAKGTLNFCLVHPRDLFREAIRCNAYAIIIAHNHPSGNCEPTNEDMRLTLKLMKIAKLIQIPILDHIIFSDVSYTSFKEKKLL